MDYGGLASFEPAFVDELSVILRWAFDYVQRSGEAGVGKRDAAGGSVYLRLSTLPLEQPIRKVDDAFAEDIVEGAYLMRKPVNAEVVIAYSSVLVDEAIEAASMIAESRCDVGLLAITSADRLHAGWTAACRARERGEPQALSHIGRRLGEMPADCRPVTVLDGHPVTLA